MVRDAPVAGATVAHRDALRCSHIAPRRTCRKAATCWRGICAALAVVTEKIFLLSPASCAGRRAGLLFGGRGTFPLARRLSAGQAVPLAEAFSFLSGLYFRGKYAYARAFAAPPPGAPPALVITTNRGLLPLEEPVTGADLEAFGGVPIDLAEARYREPLHRDALRLADSLPAGAAIVLLGSVASGKYVDLLVDVFGERLYFPAAFVGRGDMSRGGLMLRSVDAMQELAYVRVAGSVRRGVRPPRLEPRG
jgi:hypothetical protein